MMASYCNCLILTVICILFFINCLYSLPTFLLSCLFLRALCDMNYKYIFQFVVCLLTLFLAVLPC